MGAPGRKDDHDYMTDEEIASFLRGAPAGVNNRGRQALGQFIATTFRGSKKPTVLDAAAGTAINWETFRNLGVECDYTMMDRTDKMIAHAKKLYGDEISYQKGYVQELPFEDNSFDVVIMRHIMEHLPPGDMEKAIAEGIRVADKEFLIVFFLQPDQRPEHYYEENPSNDGRDGCTHFWNFYSHRRLMENIMSHGYKVTKAQPIHTHGAAHFDTIYRVSKI